MVIYSLDWKIKRGYWKINIIIWISTEWEGRKTCVIWDKLKDIPDINWNKVENDNSFRHSKLKIISWNWFLPMSKNDK